MNNQITVSFVILRNLCPMFDPMVKVLNNSTELENQLKKLILSTEPIIKKYIGYMPTEFLCDWCPNENALILKDRQYIVWNNACKYYSIAFAINYTRFKVFSNDYITEIIKWRDNDKNDPIITIKLEKIKFY